MRNKRKSSCTFDIVFLQKVHKFKKKNLFFIFKYADIGFMRVDYNDHVIVKIMASYIDILEKIKFCMKTCIFANQSQCDYKGRNIAVFKRLMQRQSF